MKALDILLKVFAYFKGDKTAILKRSSQYMESVRGVASARPLLHVVSGITTLLFFFMFAIKLDMVMALIEKNPVLIWSLLSIIAIYATFHLEKVTNKLTNTLALGVIMFNKTPILSLIGISVGVIAIMASSVTSEVGTIEIAFGDAGDKAISKIEKANKSTKQYSEQTLQAYEYVLELEQRRDDKIREIESDAKKQIEKAKSINKQNFVGAERAFANQRDSAIIVSQTEKQLQKIEKSMNADLAKARARHEKLENVDIANNANSHKSITDLQQTNINRLSYVAGLLGSLAFWSSIISAFCAVYCYAIADTLGMSVEQIIEQK